MGGGKGEEITFCDVDGVAGEAGAIPDYATRLW